MISWTGDISVNICTYFHFLSFFSFSKDYITNNKWSRVELISELRDPNGFWSQKSNKIWCIFLCEVVWNLSVMAQGSNVEQKTICSIYWWLYQNKYGIHCSSYNDSSGMLLDKPRTSLAPNEALEDGCDYEAAHDFSTSSEWHAELWGNDIESKHTFYWKISIL